MPTSYSQHRIAIAFYPNIKSNKKKYAKYIPRYSMSNDICPNYIKLLVIMYIIGIIAFPNVSYSIQTFKSNDKVSHMKDNFNQIESSYQRYKKVHNNKFNHIYNGIRIKKEGLNIIQMNKGSSNFDKYINSMQRIIHKELPDIICISESNIKNLMMITVITFLNINMS